MNINYSYSSEFFSLKYYQNTKLNKITYFYKVLKCDCVYKYYVYKKELDHFSLIIPRNLNRIFLVDCSIQLPYLIVYVILFCLFSMIVIPYFWIENQ